MKEETTDLFCLQEQETEELNKVEQPTEELAEESAEESTEETEDEQEQGEGEDKADENAKDQLTPFQEKILADLNRRVAGGDELLATAMQSKDKSINDCTKYLNERARNLVAKSARQGAVCVQVDDDDVYGWAHHYYIESKETIEQECPAMKPKAGKTKEKTAEQKKAEETAKKIHENPLLSALMKKGAKIATNGEVAVTKTTQKKDEQGNVLSSKSTTTDANGNRTTTLTKDGQTFTMTEFSLF